MSNIRMNQEEYGYLADDYFCYPEDETLERKKTLKKVIEQENREITIKISRTVKKRARV